MKNRTLVFNSYFIQSAKYEQSTIGLKIRLATSGENFFLSLFIELFFVLGEQLWRISMITLASENLDKKSLSYVTV